MSTHPSSMQTPEVETVRAFYEALNSNDISAAMKLFDPNIERVEFEDLPTGGTYRGLDEMKAHITSGRSTWAEGSCQPERYLVSGNKVVVFVHVRVRLKNKTEWIDGRVADVFVFRDDKIVKMRSYLKNEQALEWAGVKDTSN
ncbi:nuclear transport factor 2 family protein [Bdellovibrio bacteriovorus]|uniref:nuclear transport factor 2 family protein n=1 Tax=Bdellovibrio bacteriovorus TaxID=959 RepID=UPI0035A6A68C